MLSRSSSSSRALPNSSAPPSPSGYYKRGSRSRKRIWVTAATAEADLGTLHTVQTGETLAQIALAYGVSVEQIQEAMPKGHRGRRAMLRSDTALQPGQKLLVTSDAHIAGPTTTVMSPGVPGTAAGLGSTLAQHAPLLGAGLGGALLAAGAVRALSFKAVPQAAALPVAAVAPSASFPRATELGPPPPVASAVSEVRALLQDAAVEMRAVESALAAVRRAAATAPPVASMAAAVVMPLAATASGAVAVGTSAAADALPHKQAASNAAPVLPVGARATPPPPPPVLEAAPAAAAAALDAVPGTLAATAVGFAPQATVADASVAEPAAATAAVAPVTVAAALAPELAVLPEPAAAGAVGAGSLPAALEPELLTAPASPPVLQPWPTASPDLAGAEQGTASTASAPADEAAAAAAEEPSWESISVLDTAGQVAAARARVAAALEAAYGIVGIVPGEAAAASALVTAPVSAPARLQGGGEAPAAVAASTQAIEGDVGRAPLPLVTAAALGEVAGPMDAVSAGQVLDRIRVINKLLEEEQQRVDSASVQPDAAAAEVSDASGIATLTTAGTTTEAVAVTEAATTFATAGATTGAAATAEASTLAQAVAAAAAAAAPPAVALAVEPTAATLVPDEVVSIEAATPADLVADRERAQGLMERVEVLLASFESLSPEDEAALAEVHAKATAKAVAAAAAAKAAATTTAAGEPALANDPSAATISTTTTTTASHSGEGQEVASEVAPAPAAAATARRTGAAGAGLAAPPQPFMTAEALEALVRPLSGTVAAEVLGRLRDIGKLLEEDTQKPAEPPSSFGTAQASPSAPPSLIQPSPAASSTEFQSTQASVNPLSSAIDTLVGSMGAAATASVGVAAAAAEAAAAGAGNAAEAAVTGVAAVAAEAAAAGVGAAAEAAEAAVVAGVGVAAEVAAAGAVVVPPSIWDRFSRFLSGDNSGEGPKALLDRPKQGQPVESLPSARAAAGLLTAPPQRAALPPPQPAPAPAVTAAEVSDVDAVEVTVPTPVPPPPPPSPAPVTLAATVPLVDAVEGTVPTPVPPLPPPASTLPSAVVAATPPQVKAVGDTATISFPPSLSQQPPPAPGVAAGSPSVSSPQGVSPSKHSSLPSPLPPPTMPAGQVVKQAKQVPLSNPPPPPTDVFPAAVATSAAMSPSAAAPPGSSSLQVGAPQPGAPPPVPADPSPSPPQTQSSAPQPPPPPPPSAPKAPLPLVNQAFLRAAAAASAATATAAGAAGSRQQPPPPSDPSHPALQPPQQPQPQRPLYSDAGADPAIVILKASLLDIVYGTARGVSATTVQRAAIEELVTALEARNPNSMATEALSALAGRWKLVYTSNLPTVLLLGALDGMPLVDVGDVYQTIDPATLTATNKIDLAVPMLVSLRAEAGLEVRSPRQFKVRFTRVGLDTYVATPQVMAALEVPDSITVLGATLDMSPLRKLVEPINSGLEAAQGLLGRAISPEFSMDSVPGLSAPGFGSGPGSRPSSPSSPLSLWMLTTYLDDNLRISRDDEGRVFIMLKDVGIYPADVARATGAYPR